MINKILNSRPHTNLSCVVTRRAECGASNGRALTKIGVRPNSSLYGCIVQVVHVECVGERIWGQVSNVVLVAAKDYIVRVLHHVVAEIVGCAADLVTGSIRGIGSIRIGVAVEELIETIVSAVYGVVDVGVDASIVVNAVVIAALMDLGAVVRCIVVVRLVLQDWVVPAVSDKYLEYLNQLCGFWGTP